MNALRLCARSGGYTGIINYSSAFASEQRHIVSYTYTYSRTRKGRGQRTFYAPSESLLLLLLLLFHLCGTLVYVQYESERINIRVLYVLYVVPVRITYTTYSSLRRLRSLRTLHGLPTYTYTVLYTKRRGKRALHSLLITTRGAGQSQPAPVSPPCSSASPLFGRGKECGADTIFLRV